MSPVAVPAALFLLLLAGGSIQRPWLTLAIQLGACLMLGWALAAPRTRGERREGRVPLALLVATAGLALLSLIPLPPALWSRLPGRASLVAGDAALGLDGAWRSWSLDPSATVTAVMTLVVPAALFLAMLRRPQPRPAMLLGAVLAATLANALLGIAQVVDSSRRFYPYPDSDWSSASGFFANPNHLGALLLCSVPLAVGLALQERGGAKTRARRISLYVVLGTLSASLLAVTPLNASLAVTLLGGPVLAASALIPAWGKRETLRRWLSLALMAAMGLGALLLFLFRHRLLAHGQTGFATRWDVWQPTLRAIGETFPAGSGWGSFPRVFPQFEDAATVTSTWVNHAHNEGLEIALEGGLAGLMLLGLFLAWWLRRARVLWFREDGSAMGRAATVASGTLLLHSLVDYPLRTPALAGLMGVLLAMMVVAIRPRARHDEGDLWPTRHWTLD